MPKKPMNPVADPADESAWFGMNPTTLPASESAPKKKSKPVPTDIDHLRNIEVLLKDIREQLVPMRRDYKLTELK